MQTREECRKKIDGLRNKLRIVRSDTMRDPARVEREHLAGIKPLQEKLYRLRHKRTHGRELLAMYDRRLEELRLEHELLLRREQVRRIVALVRKVNDREAPSIMAITEASDANDRMREIRGLLRAYDAEIKETRRAMAGDYEQREAKLTTAIEKHEQWFANFCRNMLEPQVVIAETLAEIAALEEIEATLAPGGAINDLFKTMNNVARLMADLGDEKVARAMTLGQ